MRTLLFLCHRLPWPPDKGDKIRSYHVLRRLASRYRVYLGAFVDDPDDWQHVAAVQDICAGTCIRPLKRWQARGRAFTALTRGEALTIACYRDRVMQRWVDQLVGAHKVDLALCYSSGVAPLVMDQSRLHRIMDFVDADSDKWQQYAQTHHGFMRLLYQREARQLACFERAVARRFDASIFVSRAEADFFRRDDHVLEHRVRGIPNGVDATYWNPEHEYSDPYPAGAPVVAFVGAMDYRANVHAAQWFVDKVWPQIIARRGDARFYIVGSHPSREVLALGDRPGITVTGRVDDVRPYLAYAHVVTAPLRIARGIQNKVLEALAMQKVILATPEAWEGIEDFAGREGVISDSPETMAAEAMRWLDLPLPANVPAARNMVVSRYDWARNLDAYEDVLRSVAVDPVVTPGMAAMAEGACP